ncbi:30S ribosomal protein S6 [Candidatus Westeberhardia cardiocondylae]|uniref:Small ribosomal subunit protein bS6 n=1 Tax=Candidatus Westeberhardia cardiocondylae TaxID=1594731 RepID=A0A0H5BX21_9ENTR|nr:30S ribosomal protein S6 [Candidatus Westeberhardia cardiocondylae]MCR3756405.1 30S ribosomal subunit protein S6 [Candidatus Westeberhardia cardiocondylae]CEN32139.1 30S ribosomal protein S6 [Candidatus Westeberhardia cardiocondylae]
MRHYEIVFIIHPDGFGKIDSIVKNCLSIINIDNGVVHRLENWGCRRLAYPIKNVYKAYYILLNVEVLIETLNKLKKFFFFNEEIIRNMVIRVKFAITESSPIMNIVKKEQNEKF